MYETRLAAGLHNVLNQCRFLETSDASFINHLRCFSGWAEPKVGHPPVSRRKKERRKERRKERHALTSHRVQILWNSPPVTENRKLTKVPSLLPLLPSPRASLPMVKNRVSSERNISPAVWRRGGPSRFTLDDYKVLLFWGHSKRLFCFPFIIERRQNIG